MAETTAQMQRRFIMERECRAQAEKLKACLPRGIGFTLLLFEYGPGGTIGYASTGERASVIASLEEFITKLKNEGG